MQALGRSLLPPRLPPDCRVLSRETRALCRSNMFTSRRRISSRSCSWKGAARQVADPTLVGSSASSDLCFSAPRERSQ
eukprot:749351-Hanusia_phi.AAC.1